MKEYKHIFISKQGSVYFIAGVKEDDATVLIHYTPNIADITHYILKARVSGLKVKLSKEVKKAIDDL